MSMYAKATVVYLQTVYLMQIHQSMDVGAFLLLFFLVFCFVMPALVVIVLVPL